MAYDHYMAICHPLHYPALMNGPACVKVGVVCWVVGYLSIIPAALKKTWL